MFITRASRHDRADVASFLQEQGWTVEDALPGTVFFAREGAVVGCVRLVEVAPQTLVVEDVVVDAQRRRRGIGTSLMQAAMISRGGALYVRTDETFSPFFERLGFTPAEPGDVPDPVADHLGAGDASRGEQRVLRARA